MFYFSAPKQAAYALHLLSYIVRHLSQQPFHLDAIAKSEGIPRSSLAAVTARLVKAHLVEPCRQPPHTYSLSRPPEQMTLLEVFEAVSDEPLFADCCLGPCPIENRAECPCRLGKVWQDTTQFLQGQLAHTTLADAAWEHPIHRFNPSR